MNDIKTVQNVTDEVSKLTVMYTFCAGTAVRRRNDLYKQLLGVIARECTDVRIKEMATVALSAEYIEYGSEKQN